MDLHPHRILSLCSGTGMLDESVRLGLEHVGIRSRVVGYCERDPYAQAVLLARMAEASLEPSPVCDDIADIDERWRGCVDWVVAGFPCQPWSHAGKQAGTDDERWLWPDIARVIRYTEPAMVFLENVPGLVSGGGLHLVLDDLAEIGFDADWLHLTAEAVGASHRRDRIFILANARLQHGELFKWIHGAEHSSSSNNVADSECRREPGRGIAGDMDGSQGGSSGNGGQRQRSGNATDDCVPTVVLASREHGDERIGQRLGTEAGAGREPGSEGSSEALVNPTSLGADAGEQCGQECEPEQADEPLAVAAQRRLRELWQSSRRDGQPYGSDSFVGQSKIAGFQEWGESARTGPIQLGRPNGDIMADPAEQRIREPHDATRPDARRETARPDVGRLGLFAPGPNADWSSIQEYLWPAIEPGVRLLASGMALVLDESRADQLRCGGNGVVAIQGAVALIELVRRMTNAPMP